MTGISREGFQAKQEDDNNINIVNKLTTEISTSRSWSGFRNPRIVRVSRGFGGKDRHSKVYTIRGLRDRRIRLSVTTAIQLYDLQARLNLSQPSKVIDWLLEVTKLDIDKLPPLQMPQGFAQFYQQTLLPHHHHHHVHEPSGNFSHESPLGPNFYGANATFFKGPRYWERDNTLSRLKEKQEDEGVGSIEKGKWVLKTNDQENEYGNHGIGGNYSSSQVSAAQKLFPIFGTSHYSLLSGMINGNNAMAYNSIHHISEPNSNLSLMPHFGSHGLFSSQVDNSQQSGSNGVQIPSGYSQLLFCPPNSAATPSLFGPYSSNNTASSAESEPTRSSQLNHIQFLSSASHPHHIPIIPSMFSFKRLDSDHNNNRTQSNHRNGADRS